MITNEARLEGLQRADILCKDGAGTMVIVELKAIPATVETYSQILGYADFVIKNHLLVYRRFKSKGLTISDTFNPRYDLRLIIIAPSFNKQLRNVIQHSTLEIEMIQYQAYDLGNNEIGFDFTLIERSSPDLIPVKAMKENDDHLNVITNKPIREFTSQLITKLEQIDGLSVQATQNYLSIKRDDKYQIGQINTYKRYCRFGYKVHDHDKKDWYWHYISLLPEEIQEWQQIIFERIMAAFDGCQLGYSKR